MKNAIALVIAALMIGGAFVFATQNPQGVSTNNVYMENGKQIIEITAKGKYTPSRTSAKAGLPSVIRMKTNGTFDCSMALKIPSVNYQSFLPNSGTTDVEIPVHAKGSSLQGICAMGMYSFEVVFDE